VNIFRKHRNLFIGLAFSVATAVAWTLAFKGYTRSLGMIERDGRSQHINLDHVSQYLASFPDQTLEQWLGPVGAATAIQQRAKYRGRCAAALVCGFMSVFCLGMYLDGLKRQLGEAEQSQVAEQKT